MVNQHNYGKSPFLMGKSTINGVFSIAMLVYQWVTIWPGSAAIYRRLVGKAHREVQRQNGGEDILDRCFRRYPEALVWGSGNTRWCNHVPESCYIVKQPFRPPPKRGENWG